MKKAIMFMLLSLALNVNATWDINLRVVPLTKNDLERSAKRYAALLNRAYNVLAHCNYLEHKHPEKYELLLKPRKVGAFITEYEELFAKALGIEVKDNVFCGYTFFKDELQEDAKILDNVIVVYAHEAENKGGCQGPIGVTIMHEILHVLGFLHETPAEKKEYANILNQCIDEQALRDENK